MQANYVQRLRIHFTKKGPTRFIGHLDLARTFERAFNRADIPLAYTQGFNKRPRMQLGSPLPLGFTSECELVDIWLGKAMAPSEAQARLVAHMAPGIYIHDVYEVPIRSPALQTQTESATYLVTLLEAVDESALAALIAAMMAASSIPRQRRGKVYDLRPLVRALSLRHDETGNVQLSMTLTLMAGQTGRPDEVVAALGLDPMAVRVHRTAISYLPEGEASR